MRQARYFILVLLTAVTTVACSNKSLQKYMVEKQDDPKFMKFDIATSLLDNDKFDLSEEDRDILRSIRKINVVAYPLHNNDHEDFVKERGELEIILKQDRYKDLTRFSSENWSAKLLYTGKEDAINEVIIYADNTDMGFILLRLLGKDMKPEQLMQLTEIMQKGELDLSPFSQLENIFN